jgi:hypothetical protein
MTNPTYLNEIDYIIKRWKNVWLIPQSEEQLNVIRDYKFEGYDIESITRELIPENLKEKFESIVKIINQ